MKRLFLLTVLVVLSVFSTALFSAGAAEVASAIEAESETAIEIETAAADIAENEALLGVSSYEESEPPEDSGEVVARPAAPSLSLFNSADGLTVSWSRVDEASYYIVYYRKASDNDYISFETSGTSCIIPETESGKLYFVKALAVNADGVSGFDSPVKSMTYIARAGIT